MKEERNDLLLSIPWLLGKSFSYASEVAGIMGIAYHLRDNFPYSMLFGGLYVAGRVSNNFLNNLKIRKTNKNSLEGKTK